MGTYDRIFHRLVEDSRACRLREERYPVTAATTIKTADGRSAAAVVLNLSDNGAKVRTCLPLRPGERISLRLEPLGFVWTEVRWVTGNDAGLQVLARDPFFTDYQFSYPP